jgi:His-Xaa-Ser system radical SAM maturase HxsB
VPTKFESREHFATSLDSGYRLLPFAFTPLDEREYVLTNQAGEYVLLDRATLVDFARHRLDRRSPSYATLKSKHFLMDSDSDVAVDLLSLKVRTKHERFASFTGLHIFVTTLRCEHACPYCQVSRQTSDKAAFDMSQETADKSLSMVFRSPSPAIKIEFQGGEPLLNFDLIKYLVCRARELNAIQQRNLQFVIATNLAMLTDDMLAFCREHDIHISTSLDGPADIHNKNRPRPGGDSHERAVAGITRVREALGRDRVSALMTTTEASLDRATDIVDEYIRLGFDRIFLRPLSPYGFAIKTKSYDSYRVDRWLKFYLDGLGYILDVNRRGHYFAEHYASILLGKMLTPLESGYVDLRSPAGIGIGALVYNYDGDVYASDESRMLAEMGDKTFRLGNVHEDSWEAIMTSEALLEPLEASFAASVPMCADCAFQPYCGSDPVFHHATQGDFVGNKPTSEFCTRNMAIIRRLINLLRSDETTRQTLTEWITA